MDVSKLLKEKIVSAVSSVYGIDIEMNDIEILRPDNSVWGDYSTNIAMRLVKQVEQQPKEIANKLCYEISQPGVHVKMGSKEVEVFSKIDAQDPGFMNFTLSEEFLARTALASSYIIDNLKMNEDIGLYRGKTVLFEYTDPNPFKALHIGHLMTNTIGESLSRIYELGGADSKRVNYQGDVGLHVAKSIWGALQKMEKEKVTIQSLEAKPLADRVSFFAKGYVLGNVAYEDDSSAKEEMNQLNFLVYFAAQERLQEEDGWKPVIDYQKFLNEGHSFSYDKVKEIYYKGREWSLESFEEMYAVLGTKFDNYYFESMAGEYGSKVVEEGLKKGVFKEDKGAVIFPGEEYGLHTRVFTNSLGLPVYETKDLGLALLKAEDYDYDLSFIITGNEVNEYFRVVLKALEQLQPDLAKKTTHIGHGMLRFKEGKMSSRTGDVIKAEAFLADVKSAVLEQMEASSSEGTLSEKEKEKVVEKLAVGAIRYSVLRQGIGKDVIFDPEHSISVTGNTGPYLQYTHARTNSVLEKAQEWDFDPDLVTYESEDAAVFQEREVAVVRHMNAFGGVFRLALTSNSPNLVCEYLFELAQKYNALYNDLPILTEENDVSKMIRLQITKQTRDLLKTGLWTLGIKAPDRV